ncbi:MAG: (deoxy)nucleoside triphosphate pyrophosphohydrolase [Chitinivibrionales bacterium]
MTKKPINVVCAIIEHNGKILLGKRSAPRQHAGFWELPGGKIDPGETAQNALSREIMEELGVTIEAGRRLSIIVHEYETQAVRLIPFMCRITKGTIKPLEYQETAWINPATKIELPLLPPDYAILEEYARIT